MTMALEEFDISAAGAKTLDEVVAEAGDLAALPQVILKLIDLTADPKVSALDVEKVIQIDQGTTARVLTLANSSYYGLPRRISSVRDAVVFLGFKAVRNLAMQVTAFNMFLGKSDSASIAKRNLWKHSLNTALATKVICKRLRPGDAKLVEAEDAFTAALLHDMGKMALLTAYPKNYTAALMITEKSNLTFYNVERDFLPFTHSVVGNAMAQQWSLPDGLCDTILNHHTPLDAQVSLPLTAVVALADEIANGRHERQSAQVVLDDEENQCDAATILGFEPSTLQILNDACKLEIEKGLALS
jgi:putative nucleotidyltransferase with HDIG domain